MSGGYSKNFVPDKSTFRQDSAPVNPSGGDLWIDTSGNNVETNIYAGETESWELLTARGPDTPDYPVEGSLWRDESAQALKQYDGSNFKSIGNAIDGSSITENAQGEIQVQMPSKLIIGDFEQTLDGWSKIDNGAPYSSDSGVTFETIGATRNNYSIGIYCDRDGTLENGIKKDIDVSDVQELIVPITDVIQLQGSTGGSIKIIVDGTEKYNSELNISAQTIYIDLSKKNGVSTIEILGVGAGFGDSDARRYCFDEIKIRKSITRVSSEVG